MAYLIVSFDNQEVERLQLAAGSIVVGRAPDCRVALRDIQLSRHHCRIAKTPDGYVLHDLQSRNGTLVNGRMIARPQLLRDGDMVRVGRTRLTYRIGTLRLPASAIPSRTRSHRPLDPHEALAGTVAGFEFKDVEEQHQIATDTRTIYPRPKPAAPVAYERDDVYRMLEEIASSSWDSILAENSRPVVMERRPAPRPMVRAVPPGATNRPVSPLHGRHFEPAVKALSVAPPLRRRGEVDLCLQVGHDPPAKTSPEPDQKAERTAPRRRLWVVAAMVWAAAAFLVYEGIAVW